MTNSNVSPGKSSKFGTWISLILIILIILVILAMLALPIIYMKYYNEKPSNVNIAQGQNPNRKMCQNYPVPCDGKPDDYCSTTCVDNMEYSCQEVHEPIFNDSSFNKLEPAKKYCLPEKKAQEYPCDIRKGCVPTWTGWGDTNRMEWDSLCMYPNYFGGNGCTPTPGVCNLNGINFMKTWEKDQRDYSQKAPGMDDCVLPEELKDSYKKISREDGTPLIVLKTQCNFYGRKDECS